MKSTLAAGMFALASAVWGGEGAFADDVTGQVKWIELVDNGIVVVLQPEDEQLEAVIIWMNVDVLPPNPPPNPPESYPATMLQVAYELAMAMVTEIQVTFTNVETTLEGVLVMTSESAMIPDWGQPCEP